MNRFTPIYSRTTRLVRSKQRGVGRQRGEGLNLPFLTLATRLRKPRRKKLQKGGRISGEVSKPPGYDLSRLLTRRKRRRR